MGKLSRLAVCSLVLGALSFLIFLLIPLAIITGLGALYIIRRSQGRLKGRGFALAGVAAGIFAILFALFAAMGGRLHYRSFKAPSASMSPTIKASDRMVVNLRAYETHDPARGDIVFYELLDDGKRRWMCKRVVGLPGEEVEIRSGRIFVGNLPVDIPRLPAAVSYLNAGEFGKTGQSFKIPDGSYFMLGDNPSVSFDGRQHGAVDKRDIKGKYLFSYKWLSK